VDKGLIPATHAGVAGPEEQNYGQREKAAEITAVSEIQECFAALGMTCVSLSLLQHLMNHVDGN
jgi:hypothetical protein